MCWPRFSIPSAILSEIFIESIKFLSVVQENKKGYFFPKQLVLATTENTLPRRAVTVYVLARRKYLILINPPIATERAA